jgi:sarcosine oxidase
VTYDVIVAGLGAMGSATTFYLASRKQLRVLALDRHHPPHKLGSTHGGTRIIRETSFEHPRYVPLVRRAYECWRHMEAATRKRLLRVTGGVFIGARDGTFVAKSKESADVHQVPYEILSPAEIRRRFPAFRPDESAVGFYEAGAGILEPETCVQACLDYAQRAGIDVKFDEPVTRWSVAAKGGGVTVTTPRGTYRGGKLLLAAGPWMLDTLRTVGVRVTAERIVMHWFAPKGDTAPFDAAHCPLALWEFGPNAAFATFPIDDGEIKTTIHHGGEPTTPDTVRRDVGADEIASMRAMLKRFLPGANGEHRRSAVCLYTNVEGGDFLIDHHPEHPQVLLASPCSGFGFKFASAVGELLADLLVTGKTKWDLRPFGIARLTSPARGTGRSGGRP